MPHTIPVGARSLFVTATAWLFILLGAAASAFALVQQASFAATLPAMVDTLPWLAAVLLPGMRVGLVLSVALLVCAVGLLLRFDWARRLFIGLLVLTLTANLGGLVLQQVLLQAVIDSRLHAAALPPQTAEVVGGFVTATRVLAVALTLAASGALLWVIRRLMSPAVRHEFA